MRIAQVAPLHEAVPPKLYGGTERVVSYLTEELVALGHDVTLFASGDSTTRAKLVAGWPRALRQDTEIRDRHAPHVRLMELVGRQAHDFDVLHCHLDYLPFSLLTRDSTPFVTTLHGRLDLPELQPVFELFPHAPIVSISDSQRTPLPQANFIRTIQHGLPETLLRPVPGVEPSYLAFLGRICPEKRPDRAIRIAAAAGMKLRLAAKVDAADRVYFAQEIEPMLRGQSDAALIGEIDEAGKPGFLSGAIALLMPIDWPEPFGLVMIEAMACGVPVIAYNHGSVPEIIEDGLTGLIVDNERQAVEAVRHATTMDRALIRRRFEERFTARRMAEEYVEVYRHLLRSRRAPLRLVG
jgi:glycosyltransferase involved in cell wall biosynthesis